MSSRRSHVSGTDSDRCSPGCRIAAGQQFNIHQEISEPNSVKVLEVVLHLLFVGDHSTIAFLRNKLCQQLIPTVRIGCFRLITVSAGVF